MAPQDSPARVSHSEEPMEAWLRHMRSGEWERAWAITDLAMPTRAREPCWHWPRHQQYIWTGQPLANRRVLVRCYHGLGDTLQFIRYMPLLKAIAREVIVWAQPPLLDLLRSTQGIDRLLPLHDGAPEIEYDVDVEIMELPHVFRTTLATLPAKMPYLHAEPMQVQRNGTRPAIGLVWKGGDWDGQRSIPFASLAPLAQMRDVEWFILQPWAREAGWKGEFGTFLGEFDISDYARAVRAMDLFITIDSMPAHLAGALGVPTWTLLAADADWRWMEGREDSPWYPGMRLFRQPRAGDWDAVIARLVGELQRFAGAWKS